MHHTPAAIQRQFRYRQFPQQAGGQLKMHRVARQQCQPEAGHHAFAQRIQRGDLNGLGEMRAFLPQVVLGGLARAGARFAYQQRIAGQILQRQRGRMAQRMLRRGHGNDRVVEERHELQVHVGRHLRHDQQVVAADRQAFDRLGVIDHHQLQADLRMQPLEGGEQVRGDVLGAGFHRQVQLPL